MLELPKRLLSGGGRALAHHTSGVVCQLYRSLLKEVREMDKNPLVKALFPVPKELQRFIGIDALYTPGGFKYADEVKRSFRDPARKPNLKLAFDTLSRLRMHKKNLEERLPLIEKSCTSVRNAIKHSAERNEQMFRAERVCLPSIRDRCVVPLALPGGIGATNLILHNTDDDILTEGTVLLAHPLSSAHVDRRVMMITERSPVATSAVVLDLKFTYPLSRGNPMFSEVFWGHAVYDGGFSQIGFTMPPTAQITILHTVEPSTRPDEKRRWITWKEADTNSLSSAHKKHDILCRPLIRGKKLDNGELEPTLYISKIEALSYLSELVPGRPRSSVRIFWGTMRWPTSQIDAEVRNGHWIPVKVSPSFFGSYDLSSTKNNQECFPTKAELEEVRHMREEHYGANVSLPETFSPDQTLRKRDPLWDEILYAVGGEYRALVGCSNPFSGSTRWAVPQIIAQDIPSLPETNCPAVSPEKHNDEDLILVGKGVPLEKASPTSNRAPDEDGILSAKEDNSSSKPDKQ